jgi:hypothetical protein
MVIKADGATSMGTPEASENEEDDVAFVGVEFSDAFREFTRSAKGEIACMQVRCRCVVWGSA